MTTNSLQHIDNPPAPRGLPSSAIATWAHLAPQVCRWSNVTALDLSALELFVMTVHHLERINEELGNVSAAGRAVLIGLRDQYRELLASWCQAFLLGPEVLEEIVTLSDRTVADLLGRGGSEAWPTQ